MRQRKLRWMDEGRRAKRVGEERRGEKKREKKEEERR